MIISCLNPVSNFKVLFSDALLEKMMLLGKSFYPKEFGGILTGIKENGYWVIVDIEVPSRFESKKSEFVRYPDFLNNYLQKIFIESKSKIEYLGEWHTHPNGSTMFSSQDLISMIEIADDLEIKNKTPILMILSLNDKIEYQLYTLVKNNLITLKITK